MAINSSRAWERGSDLQPGGAKGPAESGLGDTSKALEVGLAKPIDRGQLGQLGWVREGADHSTANVEGLTVLGGDASLDCGCPHDSDSLSDHRPRCRFVGRPEAHGAEAGIPRLELSDYWVVTSDVRKAATVDVEREDPLDLLDCRRDYRWGKRVAPLHRAVNSTGFLMDAHCNWVPVAVDAESHLQVRG